MHLVDAPLVTRLAGARRILVAGAGGGYDVYCGLPLYFALREAGKEVHLASLTFTYLGETDCEWTAPGLARVTAATRGAERYFPERALSEYLASRGIQAAVHCLEKVGVRPLRAAYRRLVDMLDLDAIVLVDGGTDILMRGDEPGLGTPEEDMASLAAVAGLEGDLHRLVACLGFGVDRHHGVQHAYVLDAVAALQREGGFLGAISLLPSMPEAQHYAAAVQWAHHRFPSRESVVNASIASALAGDFGDVHRTARTHGSTLFISPLMTLFWGFELAALARRSLYLSALEGTETIFEVGARIEAFRRTVVKRPALAIPH